MRAGSKWSLNRFLSCAGIAVLAVVGLSISAYGQSSETVPGQFIVMWKAGVSEQAKAGLIAAAHVPFVRHFKYTPGSLIKHATTQHIQALRASPFVEQVEADHVLHLQEDPLVVEPLSPPHCEDCGGGGSPPSQYAPAGVVRIGAAPGQLSYTGAGIGVAVVDFGIDATHRDWVRTDGTNVIRDCYAPFQQECGDTQYPNGHGTHVAGIIAAADNTVDVVGVAPGASIYDYNAVDGGLVTDGTLIVVLDQVLYASHRVLPNIRVVNMSVGRYKDASNPNDGAALLSSITNLYNAGIAVVVAAGNDPTVQVSDMIPAGFTTVLSVASTTATWGAKDASSQCVPYPQIVPDTASFFTTDGTSVTISAPGEKQENLGYYYGACGITAVGIDSLKRGGGVVALPGTSMAAPHVTGVIALVLQRADQLGLTLSVEDIRSQIKNSANRIGVAPLDSIQVSYTFDGVREGIISASGALQFP